MSWFAKGVGGERKEGPRDSADKFPSPLDHYEQRPLHVWGRGNWEAGRVVQASAQLARVEAAGQAPLGVVSLCFGQVGPVVSEATTAPADNICLMFHLFGFIDWFLDY